MDLPYFSEGVSERVGEAFIRQEAEDILQEELDDDRILSLAFLGFEHCPTLVVIAIVTLPEDFLQAKDTPRDWEIGFFELPHDTSSREVLIDAFALALILHFEVDNVN